MAGPAAYVDAVRALTRLSADADGFAATATLRVPGAVVELDLAGAIDVAAERARLTKDLDAAHHEVAVAQAKLDNAEFLAKAPEPVVAKIRARSTAAQADIARITAQLSALVISSAP